MKKTLRNIVLAYWVLLFSYGCNSQEVKLVKETRFLMGTLFDITVSDPDPEKARKAIEEAFNEIHRIEHLASRYIQKSEVAIINRQAGKKSYPVDNEIYELLRKSIHYSQLTKGAFDVTIGAITHDLWKFENEQGMVPSQDSLFRSLRLVNFKNILLKDKYHVMLKEKGMKVDLGAVAKGYAVDRGIEILREENISSAILNGGGDLKAIGVKSPGLPWKVGIRHPRKASDIIISLEAKNIAIATSGDYQKYFIKDDVRYHHLLDPHTGMPARGLQSVTVVAKETILADAMSTAVFVMGPDKGIEFIESQSELEGVLVSSNGEKIISSGLQKLIEIHENN